MALGLFFRPLTLTRFFIFAVIGVLITLLTLGGIHDIREGTVISAILTGKIIGWLTKRWQSGLRRLAFPDQKQMETAVE